MTSIESTAFLRTWLVPLRFRLNGVEIETNVRPTDRLLALLRNRLGATGTKEGCGEGECGACTVLVDGRAINSCLFPALEVEGRDVLTIEGVLEKNSKLSAIQEAFVEEAGAQCGFCTPGMIMAAVGLLAENASPTNDQVRDALTGNLCRCTGYLQIVESIAKAAKKLSAGSAR